MKKAKLDIFVAMFAYSGNGGIASTLPEITLWWGETRVKMHEDERVGRVMAEVLCDTPVTLTRNAAVQHARQVGADVIMMVDSDNEPDIEMKRGANWATPFWDSSFDFLYERSIRGLPTVVGAPYCGPPPHPIHGGEENPYLFRWHSIESEDEPGFSLVQYTREEAALMKGTGIREVAALPTGLILYSLDAFDLINPPYFDYDYEDEFHARKVSTEDVVNTRDISLAGWSKLKEAIVYANHNAWAGHRKVKCVGAPILITADSVSKRYRKAIESGIEAGDRMMNVNFEKPATTSPPYVPTEEMPYETRIKEPEPEQNGWKSLSDAKVPIVKRRIAGRPTVAIGPRVSDEDLEGLERLAEAVAGREESMRIIEVGGWVGECALALSAGMGAGVLYCIDTFEGDKSDGTNEIVSKMGGSEQLRQHFADNVGDLLNTKIKMVVDSSREAASTMQSQDANLILVHHPEDLDLWIPHLHPDGFICGLAADQWESVLKARFGEEGCDVRIFEGTTLWVVSAKEYRQCLERSVKSA